MYEIVLVPAFGHQLLGDRGHFVLFTNVSPEPIKILVYSNASINICGLNEFLQKPGIPKKFFLNSTV